MAPFSLLVGALLVVLSAAPAAASARNLFATPAGPTFVSSVNGGAAVGPTALTAAALQAVLSSAAKTVSIILSAGAYPRSTPSNVPAY